MQTPNPSGTLSPPHEGVQLIAVAALTVAEERATAILEDDQYEALKASVARDGIKVPLDVVDVDGSLVVVDGFNRCRVAGELGLEAVPCRVRKGTMKEAMLENLVSNHRRGKNRPQDMARVVVALARDHGATREEISRETGLSAAWIGKLLRLEGLHPDVLAGLDSGNLSVGVALELARLPTAEAQLQSYTLALHHGWTVDHAAMMVDAIGAELQKPPAERVPLAAVEPAKPICPLCGVPTDPAGMTSALVCTPCWGVAVFAVRSATQPPPAAN